MLSGLINTNERTVLSPRQVKVDGGTQMRAGLHEETVEEYRQHFNAHKAWGEFPPIVVFHDGTDYWLADGFHRVEAAKREFGNTPSGYIHAEVRSGTRRDAILYAAAANANHGLRRTNADKRRAVEVLLRDEEWRQWSDREIGRRCDVHHQMVSRIRSELASLDDHPVSNERTYTTRHGTTTTMNTANIGANQPTRTKTPIRHDATLPALNVPSPGTYATPLGALPKNPIEDWELEEIVEQVAQEYYGSVTATAGAEMTQQSQAHAGDYWAKLRRVLDAFDVTTQRIEAAVAATVERLVGERRALRPGSPEAKALGKEIKAATWGDQFPTAPERSRPAEVWELERVLAPWAAQFGDTELRSVARKRGGALWWEVRNALQALGTLNYRDRDLVAALHNLASQKEQRAGSPAVVETTTIEEFRAALGRPSVDEESTDNQLLSDDDSVEIDPWVAAWQKRPYDSMVYQADRLVVQLEPWAQAWTDDKGRTWRDVVERNPQHANSPFRQDLEAACGQRGLMLSGEEMAATIQILFSRLQLDAPAQGEASADFADSAEEEAAETITDPVKGIDLVVDGDRPLPAWVDGEADAAEVVTVRDVDLMAQAAAAPVSQREGYDSDEWYTPGWVIKAAKQVMDWIDLDPASCALAQDTVKAYQIWTKDTDGLKLKWFGRVWLNPPYSAPGAFVDKLVEEYTAGNVAQACVLLNNATETKWFQRLLARFPVCFFSQRLAFWRHDHEDVGARQGQALFYLGPDVEKFVDVFGEYGIVVKRLD